VRVIANVRLLAMAYDEALAKRVREVVGDKRGVTERKMFGGLAFMLRGNMFVGILEDRLMARVGPQNYERALASPGAREMDFTGKPMRGYVFVDSSSVKSAGNLKHWVGLCADFAAKLRRRNE
jgi:TfoX/Sxy family transcriptional regulator of competence genes